MMLSPGEIRPGQDPAARGGLFQSLTRLAARSGLLFIDVDLQRPAIEGVARTFEETRIDLANGPVWALAEATPNDATGTGRIGFDGRSVVQAANGHWLPLPLLRFIGRDDAGRARFDAGPTNWARLHLTAGRDGAARAVVALDTDIDPRSRLEVESYSAPTQDDVRFGSTFGLSDDPVAIAEFLAEDWVQAWLAHVFEAVVPSRGRGEAPRSAGLGPVAAYLTLLRVLTSAGAFPGLQFFDLRADIAPPTAVDLVLDLGTCRTAGLLVEAGEAGAVGRAELLAVRDLSDPAACYQGALDSQIVFARAEFGNESLSRRSGRPEAFRWPSLVRFGPEALRLARGSRAEDGATTIPTPKAHIGDLIERQDDWRFAIDPRRRLSRSPMVTGPLLAHVPQTAAGLLTGPTTAPLPVMALRPRFSRSTAVSLLVGEVLLQALAQINTPVVAPATDAADRDQTNAPDRAEGRRQLRHLILTLPLAMPLADRQLMRERADEAIDMLWGVLGWDTAAPHHAPPKPTVRLGLDETLCGQLVHLFDEINERFGGDARGYLETIGKARPEFGVAPSLRIAALDVGGGHTHLTIVTYSQQSQQPIAPTLFGVQRSRISGEAVLEQIIADVLLPPLAQHLRDLGHPDPLRLIAKPASALAEQLDAHWLRPAARSIVGLLIGGGPHAAGALRDTSLGDLVGTGSPETAAALAVAAANDGAPALVLADVRIPLRLSDADAVTKAALEPMIAGLMQSVIAADCDLVLLSGWTARLPAVTSLIREHRPWRPDRVVVLTERRWHGWYPLPATARAAADGKDIALVGALLGLSSGSLGLAAFGDGGDDLAGARSAA
jgi:hypothetical protein